MVAQLSVQEAREQLADLLNRAAYGKERIILTRRGKPVVAVVPIEDLQLLQDLEDQLDLEEARAALAEAREKGTIPWEQVKQQLGL